jgi:hypothetical protein
VLQPIVLKIDPGSQTTGMAIVRVEETPGGPIHQALHFSEVRHKGERVADRMRKRAAYRRRRRTANLRYRPPRFDNRRRREGWLTPCMRSRVGNVLSWVKRYARLVPITRIDLEYVKFDTQKLQNPEIAGVVYQQGEVRRDRQCGIAIKDSRNSKECPWVNLLTWNRKAKGTIAYR